MKRAIRNYWPELRVTMDQLLPDEPKGWRELCARIQQEHDTEKLATLIKEVNSLLSNHEKGNKHFSRVDAQR